MAGDDADARVNAKYILRAFKNAATPTNVNTHVYVELVDAELPVDQRAIAALTRTFTAMSDDVERRITTLYAGEIDAACQRVNMKLKPQPLRDRILIVIAQQNGNTTVTRLMFWYRIICDNLALLHALRTAPIVWESADFA